MLRTSYCCSIRQSKTLSITFFYVNQISLLPINGNGCFDDTSALSQIEGKMLNIYGIFEGFEDYYQLSFTVECSASRLCAQMQMKNVIMNMVHN